jgi:hypothetical protein
MKFKLIILSKLMLTACIIINTYAHAASVELSEFGISNQTSYSISFAINRLCSSELGSVTGYSIKTFPVKDIIKLCDENNTCEITGYDQQNCTGVRIGKAIIDFVHNKMEIVPDPITKVNISGSIGLYQYNLFFNESKN